MYDSIYHRLYHYLGKPIGYIIRTIVYFIIIVLLFRSYIIIQVPMSSYLHVYYTGKRRVKPERTNSLRSISALLFHPCY